MFSAADLFFLTNNIVIVCSRKNIKVFFYIAVILNEVFLPLSSKKWTWSLNLFLFPSIFRNGTLEHFHYFLANGSGANEQSIF